MIDDCHIISHREPDMLMIELKREDPLEPLGFTVAGYRTADSRCQVNIFVFFLLLFLSCAVFPFVYEVGGKPSTLIRVSGWFLYVIPGMVAVVVD